MAAGLDNFFDLTGSAFPEIIFQSNLFKFGLFPNWMNWKYALAGSVLTRAFLLTGFFDELLGAAFSEFKDLF